MCWCNMAPSGIPICRSCRSVLETGRTPEGRAAFAFYIGGAQLGRSLVAPPGIPADRVKILARRLHRHAQGPRLPGRDRKERAGVLSGLRRGGAEAHCRDGQRAARRRRADGEAFCRPMMCSDAHDRYRSLRSRWSICRDGGPVGRAAEGARTCTRAARRMRCLAAARRAPRRCPPSMR